MIRQLCRRSSQYLFSEISFGNRSHSFPLSSRIWRKRGDGIGLSHSPTALSPHPWSHASRPSLFLPFFRPVRLVGVGGRQPDHPPHVEEGERHRHISRCLSALRRTAGLPLSHKSKLFLSPFLPSTIFLADKKMVRYAASRHRLKMMAD